MDIIKIGKVTDVNGRKVRALFSDTGIVSDWMQVVNSTPTVELTPPENSENLPAETTIRPWMPAIGSMVLCIFDPCFNGDGYVIGGLS